MNKSTAEKYERAAGLLSNDQRLSGMNSFATAFRKSAEANELIKSQMQTVSDETVVEEKIFNEKFLHWWHLARQKRLEIEHHIQEGERLLKW